MLKSTIDLLLRIGLFFGTVYVTVLFANGEFDNKTICIMLSNLLLLGMIWKNEWENKNG